MIGIMIILVIFLIALVYLKQKKLVELENMIKELPIQAKTSATNVEDEKFREDLWQSVNAIHLYASLSEEKAKSPEVEVNQKEIISICESILEKMKS